MKKRKDKKLKLHRETVHHLESKELKEVVAGLWPAWTRHPYCDLDPHG